MCIFTLCISVCCRSKPVCYMWLWLHACWWFSLYIIFVKSSDQISEKVLNKSSLSWLLYSFFSLLLFSCPCASYDCFCVCCLLFCLSLFAYIRCVLVWTCCCQCKLRLVCGRVAVWGHGEVYKLMLVPRQIPEGRQSDRRHSYRMCESWMLLIKRWGRMRTQAVRPCQGTRDMQQ